jgi:sugar phosphate isomerase/epimerase
LNQLPPLMLEHACFPEQTPQVLIAHAAQAGFERVALHVMRFSRDDRAWLYTDADQINELMVRAADAHVTIAGVDVFPLHRKAQVDKFRPAFELGHRFGARDALLTCATEDGAQLFDQLCLAADLAAEFELAINLEFTALGSVKTLPDAVQLVRAAARPNLFIAFDILHWARSGGTVADITAAGPLIRHVQLCDATKQCEAPSLMEEAMFGRLPPGDGALPIDAVLHALPETAMFGVEVCVAPETRRFSEPWARELEAKCREALRRHCPTPIPDAPEESGRRLRASQ